MRGERVLVVDDDATLRSQLRRLLERNGACCVEAGDGIEGLRELYRTNPDLVVLDISMPRLDGWATLERIRDITDVPVMMLTGSASDVETIRGLRSGADDFVAKPYRPDVLVARLEALLRRPRDDEHPSEGVYSDGFVDIDFPQAEARVQGRPLELTPLELRLLAAFVRHPREVLTIDKLLALVWGDAELPRDRVKIYVRYLRQKFRAHGVDDPPIQTLRGFGYRYTPPPAMTALGTQHAQ